MKKHPIYRIVRSLVRLFTHSMTVAWEIPFINEPSVFVCNHDRAYGPVAMCAHFPYADNTCPWIISQMLHIKKVPAYIRKDFWWQQGRWYTKILDYTLSYFIALVLPPLLRGAGGIPVYKDMKVIETFKKSVETLIDNKNLVIFPEKAKGFEDYSADLNSGFLYIAKSYYKKTGKSLNFYPVYVDWNSHSISVSRPLQYDPAVSIKKQSENIINEIGRTIVR